MLAAIALLLAQSPAAQHRLTWEPQADGSVTTFRRVGDLAVAARCRRGRVIRCTAASETTPGNFAVRRFDLDRFPNFTVGLIGDSPGYGCDWIAPTRSIREMVSSGQDNTPPLIEKYTPSGQATWTRVEVERHGGRWFRCINVLEILRRTGLNADIRNILPL